MHCIYMDGGSDCIVALHGAVGKSLEPVDLTVNYYKSYQIDATRICFCQRYLSHQRIDREEIMICSAVAGEGFVVGS
jgi:hypothetical protein